MDDERRQISLPVDGSCESNRTPGSRARDRSQSIGYIAPPTRSAYWPGDPVEIANVFSRSSMISACLPRRPSGVRRQRQSLRDRIVSAPAIQSLALFSVLTLRDEDEHRIGAVARDVTRPESNGACRQVVSSVSVWPEETLRVVPLQSPYAPFEFIRDDERESICHGNLGYSNIR